MKNLSVFTLIIAIFVLTPLMASADFSDGLVLNFSFDEGEGDIAGDILSLIHI